MAKNRILLEASCDRSVYELPLFPDSAPVRVAYRAWDAPILSNGERLENDVFEAAPTRSYLRATNLGEPPVTEQDAVRFTRAMSGYFKRPCWFWFVPGNRLVVAPPPSNDGDIIAIEFESNGA